MGKVKNIPQIIVGRVHNDEGCFCAVIGKPGRVYTPYVSMANFPVRKYRMANGEVNRFITQLLLKGKDYPVTKAVNHMLRVGRKHGITKGARALLLEARA